MGTKRVCLVWNMEKGEKCWGKINASIFSITHTVSVYLSCCVDRLQAFDAIRSYRHHRQKFRLELSYQFFLNLVKLVFFDFHVWQESVLIAKNPKSLEHPHTWDFQAFWFFGSGIVWRRCEELLLEFGDDSRSSSSELLWSELLWMSRGSCVQFLVVNVRQWRP